MDEPPELPHAWLAEFVDLDPVITYRHLHSNALTNDPLRVIALVDSDAFYAQAERNRLGLADDVPLVVQQWESLIAVSYPARKFGISRFDKVSDAKRKCPDVVAVHVATYAEGATEPGYWEIRDPRTHKVSLDYYRRESANVYAKFKECVRGGQVERASIDEVFIDLSSMVRERILERYPHLREVPVDAPNGINSVLPPPPRTSWTPELGFLALPEDRGDSSHLQVNMEHNSSITWHDIALSIGGEIVNDIRLRVHRDVGYTTSAGIARNKALAKLVASHRKPNAQTILRNSAIPGYLCPLPFQKIRFLGGKLGETVAEEYQATTVGDLLNVTSDDMQRKLGGDSRWLYELIRGIDRSEVKEKPALVKSMLASKNLQKPITRIQDGAHWIRVLAAELHLRLRDAQETFPGLWPKSLVLHARVGYNTTRSKQSAFPFIRDVQIDDICQAGDQLWTALLGTSSTVLNVTNLQLSFTGLEFEQGQQSIENFFSGASSAQILIPDSNRIQKRKRSSIGTTDLNPEGHNGPSTSRNVVFTCLRCGQKVLGLAEDGTDEEVATTRIRLEHEDFHVAQDLYRSESKKISFSSQRGNQAQPAPLKKNKKLESKPGSIAQYFRPSKP